MYSLIPFASWSIATVLVTISAPPIASSYSQSSVRSRPSPPSVAASTMPPSKDARIQRAFEWLPRRPEVPIDVVDIDRLETRIAHQVRHACGFIVVGVPRIYLSSRCWAYERADRSPFDAIALAGVIAHEMAHLDGADEAGARDVEITLVRQQTTFLPGWYRVRAARYLEDLRNQRARLSVDRKTSSAATTFQVCESDAGRRAGSARSNGARSPAP